MYFVNKNVFAHLARNYSFLPLIMNTFGAVETRDVYNWAVSVNVLVGPFVTFAAMSRQTLYDGCTDTVPAISIGLGNKWIVEA